MKVDIVVDKNCVIPRYATAGSAAVDLRAAISDPLVLRPECTAIIPTGLKMSIPSSMFGMIVPRSGLGIKHGIVLSNLVGIIDSDYTGEIMISAWNRNNIESGKTFTINPGDRLCQMAFIPVVQVSFNQVESLNETQRGESGLGSTGTNG